MKKTTKTPARFATCPECGKVVRVDKRWGGGLQYRGHWTPDRKACSRSGLPVVETTVPPKE